MPTPEHPVTIIMERSTAQMLRRLLNEMDIDPDDRLSPLAEAFYAISEALEEKE